MWGGTGESRMETGAVKTLTVQAWNQGLGEIVIAMGDHWAAIRIVCSDGSATFQDKLGMQIWHICTLISAFGRFNTHIRGRYIPG